MPTATPPDASLYHLSDVPLRTEDDVLSATARVSSGPMRPHDFLACVESHFHSDAENDIEAALGLYTDDIIFEASALNGLNRSFSGKEAVAKFYRELWATMRDVNFQFLQRFATEDRVVDDSLVTFEVVRDGCWRYFSAGQKIEMRSGSHLCDASRQDFKGIVLIWGARLRDAL